MWLRFGHLLTSVSDCNGEASRTLRGTFDSFCLVNSAMKLHLPTVQRVPGSIDLQEVNPVSEYRVIEFFSIDVDSRIAYELLSSGHEPWFLNPSVGGIFCIGRHEQGVEMTGSAAGNSQRTVGLTDTPVQLDRSIPEPVEARCSLSQTQVGSAASAALASLLVGCGGAADDEVDPSVLQTARAQNQPQWLRSGSARSPATLGISRIPTAEQLFVWAQTGFTDFFPGNPTTESIPGVVFRRYSSGHVLGVRGTDVLVLGPATGGQVLRLGSLADFPLAARSGLSPSQPSDAARFLQMASLSSLPSDIEAVMAIGYDDWLLQMMNRTTEPTTVSWMVEQGYSQMQAHTRHYVGSDVGDVAISRQILLSSNPVRMRVALALSEFFCPNSDPMGWYVNFGLAHFWDLLVAGAFGNFRDLLEAVTLSPLMGECLNMNDSRRADATGRVPDENYAREIMQLFTIGLLQLNLDGTPKLGGDGRQLETYSNADVNGLAHVFTGWEDDYRLARFVVIPEDPTTLNGRASHEFAVVPMRHVPQHHSPEEKRFLGVTIAANTDGPTSLGIALDTLFQHPNVGPFFCKQMIQRLVTSNPAPTYVARVAAKFNDNGAGVRGDLSAVFSEILLDPEALNPAGREQSTFGKLREPMLRFYQWARTCATDTTRAKWGVRLRLGNGAFGFGQLPLRSPTVFNFFRPGYSPPSSNVGRLGLSAPEFQITTDTTVCGYANTMETLIRRGFESFVNEDVYATGIYQDPPKRYDLADFSAELLLADQLDRLLDHLNLVLCAGRLAAGSRSIIRQAVLEITALTSDDQRVYPGITLSQKKVHLAVFMVMISPDYVVQK
jgi:uncharacterized protein (DUF1800 family)